MMQGAERRKFPRIKDKNISIKLLGDGFNTITQSLDVSASGIYCKVSRHMPVMTRVQVVLSIPGKTRAASSMRMNVDGIVVREHPVKKDGEVQYYDVAIFFNTLLPKERKQLMQYIDRQSVKTK
ncbi:MAG: PilZ domain-containing protein [Candidatus Omnitrophota bacterium]